MSLDQLCGQGGELRQKKKATGRGVDGKQDGRQKWRFDEGDGSDRRVDMFVKGEHTLTFPMLPTPSRNPRMHYGSETGP